MPREVAGLFAGGSGMYSARLPFALRYVETLELLSTGNLLVDEAFSIQHPYV